jgi:type IV pilus assembly protein PilP
MRWIVRSLVVSFVALVGCSTERAAPVPTAPPAETPVVAPAPVAPPPTREAPMPEADGRDPFEASLVVTRPPKDDDRPRKSKRFNLDQLKLVGIVSTSDAPRAMLVDPRGKGWVVTRGELVGRAEVLHDAQGDHAVSWRVDRIGESDVVLVREDAAHTIVPSSTRVLALRHDPVVADDSELDD